METETIEKLDSLSFRLAIVAHEMTDRETGAHFPLSDHEITLDAALDRMEKAVARLEKAMGKLRPGE